MMFLPFTLLLTLGFASAQTDSIGCFVEGECTNSFYVAATDTDDIQGCLDFCRDSPGCNFFTHYNVSSGCFAFQNCVEFTAADCADCVSGDQSCPDLRWGIKKNAEYGLFANDRFV